jgi:hypothetical protein
VSAAAVEDVHRATRHDGGDTIYMLLFFIGVKGRRESLILFQSRDLARYIRLRQR